MKIQRLENAAVSTKAPNDRLTSLSDAEIGNVAGAGGCQYPLQSGGPSGPIIIATHYSYEDTGDAAAATAHVSAASGPLAR